MTSALDAEAPSVLPSLWRRVLAVVVAGLLWGAGCGIALGVVWWRLAPRVPMVIRPEGSRLMQYQPDGYIAADVSFGLIALLAGVVLTIGLVVMRREHLLSALGSAVLAGLVGSVLMWQVGSRLGAVDIAGLVATTTEETTVDGPLQIRMWALLLLWPIAAAAVVTVTAVADWITARRDRSPGVDEQVGHIAPT